MLRPALLAAFFAASLPLIAAEEWTKLTTPHFELFTTAGEKKGREAILYFEQVRSFFLQASASKEPDSKDAPEAPVRIVAFRSEKQYKPYRMNEVAFAYYLRTRMRDYIVMQDVTPEHYQVAIHEYTHLITAHADLKLPVWLKEGLAELYSTLKPLGNKAYIGDVSPGRARTLLREKWIDIGTLTSAEHDSPLYNEKNRAGMFYAESWLLTHMLYLSPAYRADFSKFVLALSSGKNTADVFQSVYSRTLSQVQSDALGYMRVTPVAAVFNIKLEKSEEEAAVSVPPALDVDLSLAELLAGTGKMDEAKQEYERLAKENPGKSEVEESFGYTLWREHDRAAAREHFGKAIEDGTHNARMCFDYGMLEHGKGGDLKLAIHGLERAVELKPDYTDARLQLGLMLINEKEYSRALDHLSQIHKVTSEQAAWLFSGMAHAYAQTGDLNRARTNAEKARRFATTPEQATRADELLHYLDAKQQ